MKIIIGLITTGTVVLLTSVLPLTNTENTANKSTVKVSNINPSITAPATAVLTNEKPRVLTEPAPVTIKPVEESDVLSLPVLPQQQINSQQQQYFPITGTSNSNNFEYISKENGQVKDNGNPSCDVPGGAIEYNDGSCTFLVPQSETKNEDDLFIPPMPNEDTAPIEEDVFIPPMPNEDTAPIEEDVFIPPMPNEDTVQICGVPSEQDPLGSC